MTLKRLAGRKVSQVAFISAAIDPVSAFPAGWSLISGRCRIAVAKMSRAWSRLLAA